MHSGTRVGPYEITASIGAGGMGEVFRARDTRLNRDVAVKVLPKDFVADADRLRRFEQEAKTLAALNHPNVLTIHDAGVHEGAPYLVSELLEGKTLREEMNCSGAVPAPSSAVADRRYNPMPVRKATEYALQIAHGLAAAHGKGVIHRDLKPENIFVTKDGRVKILDFGLAKLKAPVAADVRRLTSKSGEKLEPPHVGCYEGEGGTIRIDAEAIINTTEPGMILGTPAYMSPEQVRGEPADYRADIFAFGAVLYEMLSGTRAFRRDTPVASMNAVLSEEPSELSSTHPRIPLTLARIVERCLAKQPDHRFQSARDLAFTLESLNTSRETPPLQSTGAQALRTPKLSVRVLAAAVAVTLLIAAFLAGRGPRSSAVAPSGNWRGQRLGGPTIALRPVTSPDGKEIAFIHLDRGMMQLGVMMVDSGDWQPLTTNRAQGNLSGLCWSRDGTEIFFDRYIAQSVGVFRISKYGGAERLLLENAEMAQVLPDDSLLVMREGTNRLRRIYRYLLGGQQLEPLNAVAGQLEYGVCFRVLPGGKEVVFVGRPADSDTWVEALYVLNLETGRCELLNSHPPGSVLAWAKSQHVPDRNGDFILSVEPAGDTYRLMRGSRRNYSTRRPLFALTTAPIDFDVAPDGSLYLDQVERPVEILRFSNSNQVERIPLSASYENPQKLPLPGDRLLLSSRMAGKHRLMVMTRGQDPIPFLLSKEEGRGPLALLGRDRVLCRVGSGTNWNVAIVSLADARVLHFMKSIPTDDNLKSLAGSPDGQTIYFVSEGSVWSVPVTGGAPKKIRDGNGIAPDPRGEYLLIQINQPEGTRLVRLPLAGGAETSLSAPYRLTFLPIAPNAIGPDGRVALQIAPADSWYWPAAILDPRTGKMEIMPEDNADMDSPGWDDQGRVVAAAQFLRSSLWRFRSDNEPIER